MKLFMSICLLALVMMASLPARAQSGITPDPFAGHCWGDNCTTLEGGFSATGIILNGDSKGKIEYGVIVSSGYAFLFGYSQWWAIGPSVHAALNAGTDPATGQSVTSLDVMVGITALRYVHVGVERAFVSSGPTMPYVFVAGLVAPVDLMTPKQVAQKRLGAMIVHAGSSE